jgi:hypothetical protein
MTKQVMEINALPEFLSNIFGTTKVLIDHDNNTVTIGPLTSENSESADLVIKFKEPIIFPEGAKAGALTLDDFKSIKLSIKGFKFDREEANARR